MSNSSTANRQNLDAISVEKHACMQSEASFASRKKCLNAGQCFFPYIHREPIFQAFEMFVRFVDDALQLAK